MSVSDATFYMTYDKLQAAEARVKELEEALTPFAQFAKVADGFPDSDERFAVTPGAHSGLSILGRDLTRARSVLSKEAAGD